MAERDAAVNEVVEKRAVLKRALTTSLPKTEDADPSKQLIEYAAAAYIIVGVHGADPANLMFMHKDSTLIEMHGQHAGEADDGSVHQAAGGGGDGDGRRGARACVYTVTVSVIYVE